MSLANSTLTTVVRLVWEQKPLVKKPGKHHGWSGFQRYLVCIAHPSDTRSNQELLESLKTTRPLNTVPVRLRYVSLWTFGENSAEQVVEPTGKFICSCCVGISDIQGQTCQSCAERANFLYCEHCIHVTRKHLPSYSLKFCCDHQKLFKKDVKMEVSSTTTVSTVRASESIIDLCVEEELPLVPTTLRKRPLVTASTDGATKKVKSEERLVDLEELWDSSMECHHKTTKPAPEHQKLYDFLQLRDNVPKDRQTLIDSCGIRQRSRAVKELVKMGVLVCVPLVGDVVCAYQVANRFRIRRTGEPPSEVVGTPEHDTIDCVPCDVADVIEENGKTYSIPCLKEVSGKVVGPLFTTYIIKKTFPDVDPSHFIHSAFYIKPSDSIRELVGKNVRSKYLAVFSKDALLTMRAATLLKIKKATAKTKET